MQRITFLICLGHHLSCTSSNEIVGTWTADKYSIWERGMSFLKGTRELVTGKEIILNPDLTYTESYRGVIKTGTWHVENDSLYITASDPFIHQDDSIDVSHNEIRAKRPHQSFAIKENKLIKYHTGNYCNKRRSDDSINFRNNFVVEILKKSE